MCEEGGLRTMAYDNGGLTAAEPKVTVDGGWMAVVPLDELPRAMHSLELLARKPEGAVRISTMRKQDTMVLLSQRIQRYVGRDVIGRPGSTVADVHVR